MRHPKPQPEPERTIAPVSYSVEDAAKALGIGRTFVFQLIKEGQLKAVKIGRRTLVPVKEVEAFLCRLGGAA
jgi:excisionase family DNA binding protein